MGDLSLFKIEQEIQDMVSAVWLDGGELDQTAADNLAALMAKHADKVKGVGFFLARREREIEDARAQVRTFQERIRTEENRVAYLKEAVRNALDEYYDGKLEAGLVTFSTAKNPASCSVVNAEELPAEYVRTKTITEPDKKAILDALKSGETITGAILVDGRRSLRIKGL